MQAFPITLRMGFSKFKSIIRFKSYRKDAKKLISQYVLYSLFGFRDSLTFKYVNDDVINQAEQFIANDVSNMIDKWQAKDINLIIDKTAFFGEIYENDPRSFKFLIGDRLQLKDLASYVKKIVGENNEGISHFAPDNAIDKFKRNNHQTDRYFGFTRKTKNVLPPHLKSCTASALESSPTDFSKELSQNLFNSVIKALEKKGINKNIIEKLHENQISVKVADNNRILYGKFPCILCKKSRKRMFSAQHTEKNGITYWVLSNYLTHLKNHFKNNKLDYDSDNSAENVDDTLNSLNEIAETFNIEKVKVEQIDDDSNQGNSTTLNLDIELLPEDGFSEIFTEIYGQISNQMGRMVDAVLKNNEEEHSMNFILSNMQRKLQIVQIPPDGSCLFGALAHQISGTKTKSGDHSCLTAKMRADVVAHIKKNVDSFEHELKGAILNVNEGKNVRNMKKKCKDFLYNELSDESTWAGAESIKAVCEINNVNILIMNENGASYFSPCSFDKNLSQTVVLAYRLQLKTLGINVSNVNRNHYDSVVRMEQSDVYDLSKMLASIEWKKEAAKNETIDLIT